MKWLRIVGWIVIPYIMIFVDWRKLNQNRKILAFVWIAIVIIVIATNTSPEDKIASSENTNSTSTPQPTMSSQTQVVVTPVAVLGEPLSSFDAVLGKGKENETFHRYKDDYVLVMPMDNVAYNITIQFDATDKQRRTMDESLDISMEFIPSDAVEVKQWEVEKGKDVIQYISKSLATKFDSSVFGESPAGTFIVIVKSDDNGVFSLVIAPGNNP